MATLSNSAFEAWWTCPTYYANRYQLGLTPEIEPSYLQFGTRMHALLRCHYLGGLDNCPPPQGLDPALELEAQSMLAAYQGTYPIEDFEIVDTEKEFTLGVTNGTSGSGTIHTLRGRIDMVVRRKADNKLCLFETKTESRGSKRNHPAAWTARHQGSLYTWAATEIYGEPIDTIILNVLTRGSAGKQIAPVFRRDSLHRTPQQVTQALEDLQYVGNQIDMLQANGSYPRNTSACVNDKGYKCDYYNLCHLGNSAGLVEIEPYAYLKAA